MIKKSPLPVATKAREVTFSASDLRRGERFPSLTLIGARPRNGQIITAEGGTHIKTLSIKGERADNFCITPYGYYVYTDANTIHVVPVKGALSSSREMNSVYKIIPQILSEDQYCAYAFAGTDIYTYTQLIGNGIGFGDRAVCGTLHSERLFIGGDYKIAYAAIDRANSFTEDGSTYGSGSLELSCTELGQVVDMHSWKDRIYVFHERGVSVIRAYNDPTNYKITYLPVSYSNISAFSAAICGEHIYFVADGGLMSFNGRLVRPVNDATFESVDLKKPVRGYGYGGKYFAKVTRKDGVACLYCYDPVEEAGYFFAEGADAVFANDALYFIVGTELYAATARGNYDESALSRVSTGSFSLSGSGNDCFFESVKIDGKGSLTLDIETETGAKTTLSLQAGARAFPTHSLRGKRFMLTLAWTDEDAQIDAVTVAYREVVK